MCYCSLMENLTVCLIGDDRERNYKVTYEGVADFPHWECEEGYAGEIPVALVQDQSNGNREALVAKHPDYGWCSVGMEFCRDFSPVLNQDRLERAN